VVRNSSDDVSEMITYVIPERIREALVRLVISTYEAASMISNATNRLNRSPVR